MKTSDEFLSNCRYVFIEDGVKRAEYEKNKLILYGKEWFHPEYGDVIMYLENGKLKYNMDASGEFERIFDRNTKYLFVKLESEYSVLTPELLYEFAKKCYTLKVDEI